MPRIIGSSLGEHREKTREALFTALSQLLREQSFETITMAQIARHAKVGRTAVYNHFPDKESLLFALISETTEQFTAILKEELSQTNDPLQRLRIYLRAQLALKQQFHLSESANFRTLTRTQSTQKLREHVMVLEQELRQLLADAEAKGSIKAPASATTMKLIHATLSGTQVPPSEPERSETIDLVERFILRGLGAADAAIDHAAPSLQSLEQWNGGSTFSA